MRDLAQICQFGVAVAIGRLIESLHPSSWDRSLSAAIILFAGALYFSARADSR